MQGYTTEESRKPRGFRRRDRMGNLIDDGTGFNPSAGTAEPGGLRRWEAMNPNAMSAAARLREENPGLRNPGLPPVLRWPSVGEIWPLDDPDPTRYPGSGSGAKGINRTEPDFFRGRVPFIGEPFRRSLPPGAVRNGSGSFYVPGMGDTDDGLIYRPIFRPQFEGNESHSPLRVQEPGPAGAIDLVTKVTGKILPQAGTALRGLARSLAARGGSRATTAPAPGATPKLRINKLTGMPFGIGPSDAGYSPQWYDSTRAADSATKITEKLSPMAGGFFKGFRELAPRLVASSARSAASAKTSRGINKPASSTTYKPTSYDDLGKHSR